MKRDMELYRKILFAIEEQCIDTPIYNLKVENYSIEQIAYHCRILYDANLIFDYKSQSGDDHIVWFGVGYLTWAGNEYLDKIRNDSVWNKTKDTLKEKGLPMAFEFVTKVAGAVASHMLPNQMS